MTLLFGFVGSILLFRETATVNKILGVLMILGGNIIVMFGTKFNKQDSKMIYLRILVCVMLAIGNLIDSRNGRNFPLSFYTFIGFFVGGIISYIGAKTNVAELKSEMKTNFWGQIIMGSTSAFGYILFLQAFNFAETSIVIPLSYINTIITVILGIVFLKERHSLWKKIIAIFIVFFGSLLINL
jgi:drug/metabolite transporter (DMT)-like permease